MLYTSDLMFNCREISCVLRSSRIIFPVLLLSFLLYPRLLPGQQKLAESLNYAREYLESRGEVYIRFPALSPSEMSELSKIISIDKKEGNFFYAYVSPKGFEKLTARNFLFQVEIPPSLRIKSDSQKAGFTGVWDRYPSYNEYVLLMNQMAASFPEICKLDTVGFSIKNRKILALKISDNSNTDEPEPGFLFTSSMHGDETAGFIMLLRLSDWLLNQYGQDPLSTRLVNELEIWINPLSNPDGTYFTGNESVFGAKRFNINNVDLNRNFPDPEDGPHPDGEEYQPENLAMMEFMKSRHLVMSANIHGGAEVVNYPWDTWSKLHPDDSWFQLISRQYADTAHVYNYDYLRDLDNGISNGYAWYSISGGRQDYVNYFLHGREVTMELSCDKIPDTDTLSWLWDYNWRSLLNYMEQSLFGLTGTVTDHETGKSVKSKIEIPGHDSENSFVWTDSISGKYWRLLKEGFYDVKFSGIGYKDTVIQSVSVSDFQNTCLDVELTHENSGINEIRETVIEINNPFSSQLRIVIKTDAEEEITVSLYDIGGRKVISDQIIQSIRGENIVVMDGTELSPSLYILRISSPRISYTSGVVKIQ